MALSSGARLGPYEIQSAIGAGGMGEVYRARDTRLGRDVAIKVLPDDIAGDADRLRRFEEEARAVAALNHPNILTVHDVGAQGGTSFVVTELLEGETLREVLSRRVPTQRQLLSVAVQAAHGLAAAHRKGIVHRDLKPENVFVTTEGRVKILDFGLAKRAGTRDAMEAKTANVTEPGVLMGTLAYMSPEQARGEAVGLASDVFSFGVVLYELLARRHPFRRDTMAATLSAILHETAPLPSSVEGTIPPALDGVVRRCLEKDQTERFASGHDLAVALEAVLQAPSGAVSLQEVEERSPYPGLRSFTEKDARAFFGREAEVTALWERIRARRLLAVIGPSGAGKTSFLRAGVIPARPDGWAALACTPGPAPLRGLGQALGPALAGDADALSQLAGFDDRDTAFTLVSRWRQAHADALLVVDQFEEVFTLNPPEVQARFAELLARLASEADVHVVLSLRDDFLMRCHDHPCLAAIFDGLTPLGALTREGLCRALMEPAARLGYRFEDAALVEEMVACVEGARAALPLLAFAVSRLWEQRNRERKVLTRAAYEDIGGVAGALAQHAEATLDRIGSARHDLVRELFRNLVTSQGTRAVIDRDELLSAFPERDAAEAALRDLVDARLVTSYEVEGRDGEPNRHRIEIVHESLLKAWPRLVRWQTQDEDGAHLRDQLKQAARLWTEKGQSADLLWTGTAYREYALWRERYTAPLTAVENAFAAAMAARAKRTKRVRTAAVGALVVGLTAVAIVIGISRRTAVDSARRAEASRLVTLAQLRLAADPTEALAYAAASLELADTVEARVFVMKALLEAPPSLTLPVGPPVQRAPAFSPDGTKLASGGHSQVQLLWNDRGGAPIALEGNEWSPRGPNVAAWSGDGHLVTGLDVSLATRVHVWSAEGKRLRTITFGAPTWWQVGKDHVLGCTEEGPVGSRVLRLRSWRLRDGEANVLDRVPMSALAPCSLGAFLPDATGFAYARQGALFVHPLTPGSRGGDRLVGRHAADIDRVRAGRTVWDRLFTRDKSGETRVWTLAPGGLELERVIARPATAPAAASAESNTRWVLGDAGADKMVRLWDAEALPGSRALALRRNGSWYIADPDVHPSGDWLALFQHDEGRAVLWPLRKRYPSVVDGYTPIVRPVAFSPDGRWLATSWSDNTLRLWPLPGTDRREPTTLALPETKLWEAIVFDPRGRYLFAVGNTDRAWIVPLDGSRPRRLPVYSEDTLLYAAAVSPSGRQVATAWGFGPGAKTLRLHDVETGETRVFPLPTERASSDPAWSAKEYEGYVSQMGFFDETTIYTSGWAGLRRWDLQSGTSELVAAHTDFFGFLGRDRHLALTKAPAPASKAQNCRQLQTRDLVSGTTKPLGAFGACLVTNPFTTALSGEIVATPDLGGFVVGRLSGDAAHLLVGHEQSLDRVAISPDGRWVATTGEDDTLRLWPMPDLSKRPLHTLPREELVAKLKSLTNLFVVRDSKSPDGWRIDVGPFPGWRNIPTW
jgi:WD40 repeat protein